VYTSYLLALSITNKGAYKSFEYTVSCGPESVEISVEDEHKIKAIKNQEPEFETIVTSDMMTDYFTLSHTRCPIQSYEMKSRYEDDINQFSEDYTVLDVENFDGTFVHINTTLEPTNGLVVLQSHRFTIKATYEGGAYAFQAIRAQIVVCGYETLSLTDEGSLDLLNYTNSELGTDTQYLLTGFF